jgi:hypothetical protein
VIASHRFPIITTAPANDGLKPTTFVRKNMKKKPIVVFARVAELSPAP